MEKLDYIEKTEMTRTELTEKGYFLASYDGELCLPENQRTRQNINGDGGLTLDGARIFRKDMLANLRNVIDVKILHADSTYDVYALCSK